MKKFLLVLVFVLTLTLSGCDANDGSIQCKLITPDSVECNNGTTDIDLSLNKYYTQEEVDENYYSKEDLNEMFEDFGGVDGVQGFVNAMDVLEDIIDNQEQRIKELEMLKQYKIHYFSETEYIFAIYTFNSNTYTLNIFGGCIEICEQSLSNTEYTQEQFDLWWQNKITLYEELID